jgi:hypothetical protein
VISLLCFILAVLVSPFRSKARLEAEIAMLRQQLIVLQRRSRGKVRLTNADRVLCPAESLVRWHHREFSQGKFSTGKSTSPLADHQNCEK